MVLSVSIPQGGYMDSRRMSYFFENEKYNEELTPDEGEDNSVGFPKWIASKHFPEKQFPFHEVEKFMAANKVTKISSPDCPDYPKNSEGES
jgi:hypothetical protein